MNASASTRSRENVPGSQPVEMIDTVPAFRATASMVSKYEGMSRWVSKLSTVLKKRAKYGPCSGRSTADPPQRTATSATSLVLHAVSSSLA